jgi:hypothetical protein
MTMARLNPPHWQLQSHPGAPALLGLDRETASPLRGKRVCQKEPQPHALSRQLGGEERFPGSGKVMLRNSDSSVFHVEMQTLGCVMNSQDDARVFGLRARLESVRH